MLTATDMMAECYRYDDIKDTHFVKIGFQGMTISGIMVKPSKYPDSPRWVEMPAYRSGAGRWNHYIEFKNSDIKEVIEAKCREAAESYTPTEKDVSAPAKPKRPTDPLEQIDYDELYGEPPL
jgi:hypothetical protein